MKQKLISCNAPSDRTGRTYPKDEMEKAVDEYQLKIDAGVAFGELNNPSIPDVNLTNISHRVTDMHFEGDDIYASIKILDTPAGEQLMELLKHGCVRVTPVMTASVNELGIVKDITIQKTNFILEE